MTKQDNPPDNQTPQPVDELTLILYKLRPRLMGQEETPAERVEAVEEAKARLLQWGTRQRMNEVGSVMMEYTSHGKTYPVTTDINGKIQSVEDRYRELQASLKDGGNDD